MKEVIDFLKLNSFGNLATCDGGEVDNTPMEIVDLGDGGFYFYMQNSSDVAEHLRMNACVSFCATDPEYKFLKLKGKLVLCDDLNKKIALIQKSKFAEKIFDDRQLENMIIYHLSKGIYLLNDIQNGMKKDGVF